MQSLAGRLIDHGWGILDVALSSYNHLVVYEIPRMINDLRPIVWSERSSESGNLTMTLSIRFGRLERPQLHENQVLQPSHALHLCRPYNSRVIIHIDIQIRHVAPDGTTNLQQSEICDLCIGEIPVLVGSVLCHRSIALDCGPQAGDACYFIVNGSPKVIVNRHLVVQLPLSC